MAKHLIINNISVLTSVYYTIDEYKREIKSKEAV